MMSITGACLILFVTFHAVMNAVALISPAAYNDVCQFLGANWYALIASAGLALLFIIHIIYALWLTLQNRKARGNDRYKVVSKAPQVEWSSQNMLVLGIVVLAFLGVHLVQFWAKMQLQELLHHDLSALPMLDGAPVEPAMGSLFLQMAFSQVWTPIVYIIGFIALWFHMNHGFWSMFQTCGWDNDVWINRLKKIGLWWSSIVIALFIAQAIVFTVQAHNKAYLNDPELQEQYSESWNMKAMAMVDDFSAGIQKEMAPVQEKAKALQAANDQEGMGQLQQEAMKIQEEYLAAQGPVFVSKGEAVLAAFKKQCPDVAPGQELMQLEQMVTQFRSMLGAKADVMAPRAEAPAQPEAQEPNETDSVKK